MRVFLVAAFFALSSASAFAQNINEQRTALAFSKMSPPEKRMFLQNMPKGGDLHNHLDGAVYAESVLRWAAEDGLCLQADPPALAPPPCDTAKNLRPAADVYKNTDLYTAFIDSISMRNFKAVNGESAETHFFKTFLRFLPALPENRRGDMLAEVVSRLASQNTFYVELMISPPQIFSAGALGASMTWSDDFVAMRNNLDTASLERLSTEARAYIDRMEVRKNELLKCGSEKEQQGCKVKVRYQMQIIRDVAPATIFNQMAFSAQMISKDPRVVTMNLVNWEDNPVVTQNYDAQLKMLGFFSNKGSAFELSQHAGELTLGLVPPEDLKNHIRLAVEDAGAKRIGHGVDIAYEDNAEGLLKEMAEKNVAVEVGLTSNDIILGIKGKDHPFDLYRKYGVPLTLATDDEGVSRSDLTNEYQRAAATYNLSYADLKQLARNALTYSFMKGESLFEKGIIAQPCRKDSADKTSSPACAQFLNSSEKAGVQWALENAFAKFEQKNWR